jgi:hypothetical protein
MSKPIIVNVNDWDTSAVKYMAPKVNEKGGKSVNIISTKSNRSLHISTPLMMTWGISDFVDEKTGESDGKFSMSLAFPNKDYVTVATTEFLTKLKAFENQILDDVVKNSEAWFGEKRSREVAKHTFFPFLKYPKDKDTKKIDYTKPPTISAKVPYYNGMWNIEVYDTKSQLLFPRDDKNMPPIDFVPKMSKVAAVLQCGGLWFGGKGWGITWKLIQCVVKPQEAISVYGKCHIQLVENEDEGHVSKPTGNIDDEQDEEQEDDQEDEPVPVSKTVLKTVTKTEEVLETEEAPKKKVVKKKMKI